MDISSMYFQICSGVFLITLAIIYGVRPRFKSVENNLYSLIIKINIFGIIVDLIGTYLALAQRFGFFLTFVSRLYLVYLFTFFFAFVIYTFMVAYPNKIVIEEEGSERTYNYWFCTFQSMVFFVVIISLFVLELNNYSVNNIVYTYGHAVDFLAIVQILCTLMMIVQLVINFKKIDKKKIIPVVILVLLGASATLIQYYNKELLILTFICILTTFIMYFTIENPDLQLIEQLDEAVDESKRANSAKSDFLSSMSHEIRTPLNAIVNFSGGILENDKLPLELREDAEDIVSASNTLLEIVGNIMDISKIESQKMEIVDINYSIKEVFDEVIKNNEYRLKDKDIEVEYKLSSAIPYELIGDRNHIKVIVNNLISNAYKYTDNGLITISLDCINKKDDTLLIFEVKDTGKGIKKEDIDRLFTKFDRLDTKKNSSVEGTGLGMAITKQLVELLGGTISVNSVYGEGSLFVVNFKQKISILKEDLSVVKEVVVEDVIDESIFNNRRILVVDDNKLNLKVANRALSFYNFDIVELSSGVEVLDLINNNEKFDVILMDIMMPVMGGDAALKKLKEIEGFDIPVVALTADAISGVREKYINQGFSEYLSKPFSKDDLKKVLIKILKK